MRKMRKMRNPTRGLGIVLAVMVGLVGTLWAGAIWLERTLSIPAEASLAIFFGSFAFIEFIKWINRRDDPRYAKRPPDTP